MKKLTLLFIGLVCVTQLWAQNNQKFIEITGETSYKKVPQKYIVDVVVSEALVYNNYNNETPNFEEIKTKYFDKLSKAGITLSTLKKDELGYLLTSYRKKGMNYTFETSNKDKFLSFLAVQSEGMQIQAKKLKFKEMNEAERQELMTKAISNAKAKASLLAKTLKKIPFRSRGYLF